MDQNSNLRGQRILYVAYPLLTVSDESAGGAEQMLWTLEREMTRRGVKTTVAASKGSRVAGELFPTGEPCRRPDDLERRNREHQDKIVEFVHQCAREGRPFDLVHDKSGSFWPRAAQIDVPVLATLHLPRHFYPPQYFKNIPTNASFNCVSDSQARGFAGLSGLQGVVGNGIALDLFGRNCLEPVPLESNHDPRSGLLWLGRICEEKAPHLALDIAARAGLPITLAGKVYPFSYHQEYVDREVAPRLRRMPDATFMSLPCFERKRQLLGKARALLITSLADETSSLVAMEAAASGTPVVAFARGALPEIVHDRVTGFLAGEVEDAARALRRIDEIDSAACMRRARDLFSSATMTEGYARLYARLLKEGSRSLDPSASR